MSGGIGSYERDRKQAASARRVRLLQAARKIARHTEAEWCAIVAEFDNRCVCCGCIPMGRPTKDHIIPLVSGGSDGADNLQPLCRECNVSKRNADTNWAAYRRIHGWK